MDSKNGVKNMQTVSCNGVLSAYDACCINLQNLCRHQAVEKTRGILSFPLLGIFSQDFWIRLKVN